MTTLLFLIVFIINFFSIIIGLITGIILLLISNILKSTFLNRYSFNILITFDQLTNTILGGDVDETISSRLGKWEIESKNKTGIRRIIYNFINYIVELFEKDHFKKSIEPDEGKDQSYYD